MGRPARGRIIHDLQLDAIAAVDLPCQEPAMAMILKRAPDPDRRDSEAPRPIAKTAEAFEQAVDSIMARDRCSRLDALSKAARAHPEAREAYANPIFVPSERDDPDDDDRAKARETFVEKVETIIARNPGMGRATAMSKAAREYGSLFNAAYGEGEAA